MKRAPLLLVLALDAAACSSLAGKNVGVDAGHLRPCPTAPHCVNSEATDPRHAIAPLLLRGPGPPAWQKVVAAVAATERTTVVENDANYLRAEVTSPWHIYTDDLELLFVPAQGRIEVRSASRVGYYDFQVNRKRVEALRAKLIQQGLVRG